MPIKKQNFQLYPTNWRKISWWIINIRAQSRCEGILENGERCTAVNHQLHPVTGKTVVLSVAHLDHNPQNSDQDLDPDAPLEKSNLRAFCQRCHNRWDREHRNDSIRDTYEQKHTSFAPLPIGVEPPQTEMLLHSGEITEKVVVEDYLNAGYATETGPWLAEQMKKEEERWIKQEDPWIVMPESEDKLWEEFGKEAEAKVYGKFVDDTTIEQTKHMLQILIKALPSAEALQHTILLRTLELQEEYTKLLNMTTKEFSTPQVQAQLTVYKQKLAVIDNLQGLIRIRAGTISELQGGTSEETLPDAPMQMRGHGIRTLIKQRNGIRPNEDETGADA